MEQERRDKMRMQKRIPGAFMDDNEYSEDEYGRQARLERLRQMDEGMGDEDQEMAEVLDYEDVKGQLSLWV